jgi:lysophospholipase L1-like esterase
MTMITVVRPGDSAQDLVKARVFFPYYPSAYAVGDFLDLVAAYNRAIRAVAKDEGIPIIDLEAVFGARPDYRELFIDTMHPSQVGYELVAASALEVLEKEHLLGGEAGAASGIAP